MKVSVLIGRARNHWMQDGLVEMTMGVQFFVGGLLFWIGGAAPRDSEFRQTWTIGASFLWAGLSIASMWITRWLKERIIAPRAGYVALRENCVRPTSGVFWLKALTVLMILGGTIATGVYFTRTPRAELDETLRRSGWLIGFMFALFFGAVSVWSAFYYRVKSYFFLAALALGLAIYLYGRSGGVIPQVMSTWMLMGGGTAVLGAFRLRSFLKSNPLRQTEAE